MLKTGHIRLQRSRTWTLYLVANRSRVKNSHNAAELVRELENRCARKGTGGSNPSPAATLFSTA
jgi:hypothetical protein